ncbi:hypothetical protein protein [Bacillus cereus G9241]|nr:hypothetical protein protein [Bacillus cereus G9241]
MEIPSPSISQCFSTIHFLLYRKFCFIHKYKEGISTPYRIDIPSFKYKFNSYGLVDQSPADLINVRLFNFSCATINSAISSACITLSGFPSVNPKSTAISVATVLGVKAVTRILCLRTSIANDSVKPRTPNLEALYALVTGAPFCPAVDEMLMISPDCCSIMLGKAARVA